MLIALNGNGTVFELKMLAAVTPENFVGLARLWPLKKLLVLVDGAAVGDPGC